VRNKMAKISLETQVKPMNEVPQLKPIKEEPQIKPIEKRNSWADEILSGFVFVVRLPQS
jgi:hypothetical protein